MSSQRHGLRGMSRLALAGTVAAAILLGVGATAAWAAWSATATVPGAMIKAGTLDLQFDDELDAAAGPGVGYSKTLDLPVPGLTPGESAAFAISPTNAGDADFKYTVSASSASSASSATPGVLALRLYSGAPDTQTTTYPRSNTCSGDAIGPQVILGGTPMVALSPDRTLLSGSAESLCAIVSVQSSAPASAAGTTQSVILNFTATQVTP